MSDRAYFCVLPLVVCLWVGAVVGFQIPGIQFPHLDEDYFRALIIAFAMFVGAGLGLPFPEEILIVGAGIWAATHPEYGLFRFIMLPVCVVGVVIADCLLYFMGRYFGTRLLEFRWMRWMVPPGKLSRIEKNFHDYGVSILLFGRLLPGIRVPLFLTAGILRLPVYRFVLADSLGAVLGNSLLFFLAFWFGDQFKELIERVEGTAMENRPLVIMGLIAVVGLYLVVHFLRKPVSEGDPNELPIIGHTIAEHMHSDDVKKPVHTLTPSTLMEGFVPSGSIPRSEGPVPSADGVTPELKPVDETSKRPEG